MQTREGNKQASKNKARIKQIGDKLTPHSNIVIEKLTFAS